MRNWGLRPKEALGQNFLSNRGVAEKIVKTLSVVDGETVVEVGAGLGHLTAVVARRASKVVAIEKDRDLLKVLRQVIYPFSNVEMVPADVLSLDLRKLFSGCLGGISVAANLPFNQSTEIFFKLVDELNHARIMILMFQREVAQRLTARPCSRAYGALTVAGAVMAEVTRCFHVRPGSFFPPPQVQATVVKVVPRRPALLAPCCRTALSRLVKAAFGQRRKTLRNALGSAGLWRMVCDGGGLPDRSPQVAGQRPEELSVEMYAAMARVVCRESGGCKASGDHDQEPC